MSTRCISHSSMLCVATLGVVILAASVHASSLHASTSSMYVFPSPVELWSQLSLSNGTAVVAPVVVSGWAVVANNDNSIVGRLVTDTNGSSVWNTTLPAPPTVAFALDDGYTIIVYSNDTITAMGNNGSLIWQWQCPNSNAAIDPDSAGISQYAPLIINGVLYVGSSTDSDLESPMDAYGIDLITGNTVWTAKAHGNCNGVFDASETLIYIPSTFNSNYVEAFYLSNGSLAWKQSLNDPSPLVKLSMAGWLWVGDNYGGVKVFNATTGAPATTSVECSGDGVTLPIVEVNGVVYVFNGAYVNAFHSKTLQKAFLPYTPNSANSITTFLFNPAGTELYVSGDSAINVMTTSNGRGSTFFPYTKLISGAVTSMQYINNGTQMLVGMGYLVVIDMATKKLVVGFQDCDVVGAPQVVPTELGDLIVYGNSFAVPGWPMKSMYVVFKPEADGVYWGLETIYNAVTPIISGDIAYTFDTNYMYAIDVLNGTFLWQWQYPEQDDMVTGPGLYLTPNGNYLVAGTSMASIFVDTQNQNYSQNTAASTYPLAGNAVGDVFFTADESITVVNSFNMATVMSALNESGSIACNTAAVAVGNTHLVALCKGRIELWQIANVSAPDWRFQIPTKGQDFTSVPLVLPSKVIVVGASNGDVYAFAPAGGTPMWSVNLIDPISVTLFANGKLYVSTIYGMAALNVTTGDILWHQRHVAISGHELRSAIHATPDVVIIRGKAACYGLDASVGTLLWTQTPIDFAGYGAFAVIYNNALFLTPMGSYVIGYNVWSGDLMFKVDLQGQASGVVLAGSLAVFAQAPTDQGDNEIIGVTIPKYFGLPQH